MAGEYGITETSIAVGKSGEIKATEGINRQGDTVYPIMSLSKAITAVCLSEVITETVYSFETKLAALLAKFSKLNIQIPSRLSDATLVQLVLMTSGLVPDLTQGDFKRSYGYGDTRNIAISKQALQSRGV